MVDCVIHPVRLALLSSKMHISPDKLNNLCITDRNYFNKKNSFLPGNWGGELGPLGPPCLYASDTTLSNMNARKRASF